MNTPKKIDCDRLDDYFDGALAPSEAGRFESHLSDCAACREAVGEQRWIDDLLRSNEAAALEAMPAPATVAMAKPRPRRVSTMVAAAAAAVAATAALFIPLLRRSESDRGGEGLGEGRPTVAKASTPELSPAPDDARVGTGGDDASRLATAANPSPGPSLPGRGIRTGTFVGDGSSIAIPVASDDPQVTIMQLYPTVTATRRWAREGALRLNSLPSHGG